MKSTLSLQTNVIQNCMSVAVRLHKIRNDAITNGLKTIKTTDIIPAIAIKLIYF